MELRQQDVTDPENELLARVARGDRDAFERLYNATSSRLFGVCLRLVADRSEAEDVLQDVYVSAWRKAPQFDPQKSSAAVWLAAIARHRAIDRLRASAGLREQAPVELAESQPDPAPAPSHQAEADSERARLDDCVGQLEPRRRSLIRTAFFDGATYEELAARSGSPLGSVKSWIRRGLLQLRACLEA
jgi:RNA polymerase sigma-70 factor (ECF subfamily)